LGHGLISRLDPPKVWLFHGDTAVKDLYDAETNPTGIRYGDGSNIPAVFKDGELNDSELYWYTGGGSGDWAARTENHMYIYSADSETWTDRGTCEGYFDTLWIVTDNWTNALGHLRCQNITCGNHNPLEDLTYGLGSPTSRWLGGYLSILYASFIGSASDLDSGYQYIYPASHKLSFHKSPWRNEEFTQSGFGSWNRHCSFGWYSSDYRRYQPINYISKSNTYGSSVGTNYFIDNSSTDYYCSANTIVIFR
jgi:hypothetical protein